jgi:hypothetical protein
MLIGFRKLLVNQKFDHGPLAGRQRFQHRMTAPQPASLMTGGKIGTRFLSTVSLVHSSSLQGSSVTSNDSESQHS